MKWDLTRLYNDFDDPRYAQDVEALRSLCEELLARAKTYDGSTAQLVGIIRDAEKLSILEMKAGSFAWLTVAADATNEKALAACDKLHPINNITAQFYSALSAKLGEIEDLVVFFFHKRTVKAEHRAVEKNIFAGRQVKVKARAKLYQGRYRSHYLRSSLRG